MGLSNKKEEQLRNMPVIESRLRRSKDGKYILHQTVITHIKPTAYYQAVIDGKEVEEPEESEQVPEVSEA